MVMREFRRLRASDKVVQLRTGRIYQVTQAGIRGSHPLFRLVKGGRPGRRVGAGWHFAASAFVRLRPGEVERLELVAPAMLIAAMKRRAHV